MARTNKTNWEKIALLLKGKGASDIEISTALKDATTNKEKEVALSELQEKYHVTLRKGSDKNPTLQEYFGKIVADLLIRRKELINTRKININKFSKKSIDELTLEEQKQYLIYLQNKESLTELEEIDEKLRAKGLSFIDSEKEHTTPISEKKPRKKAKTISKEKEEKAEEPVKEPESKIIQF